MAETTLLQARIPIELKTRVRRAIDRRSPRPSQAFFVIEALEAHLQAEERGRVLVAHTPKPRHRRNGGR